MHHNRQFRNPLSLVGMTTVYSATYGVVGYRAKAKSLLTISRASCIPWIFGCLKALDRESGSEVSQRTRMTLPRVCYSIIHTRRPNFDLNRFEKWAGTCRRTVYMSWRLRLICPPPFSNLGTRRLSSARITNGLRVCWTVRVYHTNLPAAFASRDTC
jgi:hypothetical protein